MCVRVCVTGAFGSRQARRCGIFPPTLSLGLFTLGEGERWSEPRGQATELPLWDYLPIEEGEIYMSFSLSRRLSAAFV